MRELILLRHAEAMPVAAGGSDRDRPLSLRGEAEARDAGEWLREQDAMVDAALSSPARRAQMTIERTLEALGGGVAPHFLAGIYEATPGDLLALLEQHAGNAQQVLLVGHNPGLEQLLALLLEGRSDRARGMPPAGVAWLQLDETRALEPGSAKLRAFWSP
ncbi:MAG TPA: histidine phosphatase family protein [Rhodanobacteraceae bacterium]|nr:histidine phosphatase family protein [Rhodanobacteraceae bacterium]